MPYEFSYKINNTDHVFRCDINSVRCEANKNNGGRCERVCAIGTPFCWSHLLNKKKLRIKTSGIPRAGKGLYAQANRSANDKTTVVFAKNKEIINYTGDIIDNEELTRRYDLDEDNQFTAPYGFELKKKESFVDSACNRGVAALVNHKSFSKANATFVKTRRNGRVTGITLKAKKNITNNQEIFASYGTEYNRKGTTHKTTYKRNPRRRN